MEAKISAVVLAAGMSSRMGFDKIFYKLLGKETVFYSLEAFDNNPEVDEIILVIPVSLFNDVIDLVKGRFKKLTKIVAGGDTRTISSYNGVKAASGKYVLIHDGARPLISQEMITDCIKNVEKYDAVTVCLPVTDTLKSFEDGKIKETVDRSSLVAVQTPQCFNKEIYMECYKKEEGSSFTDDCALMEKCSVPVKLILGDEKNIKLTTKKDIAVAEALLKGDL